MVNVGIILIVLVVYVFTKSSMENRTITVLIPVILRKQVLMVNVLNTKTCTIYGSVIMAGKAINVWKECHVLKDVSMEVQTFVTVQTSTHANAMKTLGVNTARNQVHVIQVIFSKHFLVFFQLFATVKLQRACMASA